MARVLIVLGAADHPRSESCLRREWLPSMLDGLALAGRAAPPIEADFLDLDALPVPDAAGPDQAWQQNVLRGWAERAAFDRAPSADPAAILVTLGRSRYFPGIPPDQLTATLGRLHRYLHDGRPEVDAVTRALTPETSLVIAHSLATIPVLNALADRPNAPRVLTMSSPAALDSRLRKKLTVEWWNLWHGTDALCEPVPPGGQHDCHVECDPRLRGPREYLATAEFGHALAAALS
ncbi:MAG TPA: hypothetical protein VHC49_25840 [Mycobacteriales bacterium]|nr:hypothetical protein [Mycobacteriales bacterium]